MTAVIDASALLAYLHGEPGGDRVQSVLETASISAVNWSEVVQKSIARKVDTVGMREDMVELGLNIEPFTMQQADRAATLWRDTKKIGLSLADRACLSLAIEKSLPLLTADRAWKRLELKLDIRVIR